MMYSDYVKQRILFYRRLGKTYVQISCCLSEEEYAITKVGVYKFVKRYEGGGIISHSPYNISYVYSWVGSFYTYLLLWQIYLATSRLGRLRVRTGVVRIRA